jgi:hypothetical protein
MKAAGGESITQCSSHNNDWCCNADAQHVDCCKESPSPRPFFALQDGQAYATIGRNQASSVVSLASITGLALATGSGSGSQASKTSAPSSAAAQSSVTPDAYSSSPVASSATPSPVTSIQTSVSTGSAGVVTVQVTIVSTPPATPTTSNTGGDPSSSTASKSNSKLGVIIGCAVGIPLALALAGIIFWILRKRRQPKVNPYKETSEVGDVAGSPGFAGGAAAKLGKKDKYRHSQPGSAEIDSNPVGPGRPVSHIPGHAELDSGAGFRPGHGPAYTPDMVGIGGGNGDGRSTWNSAPPGYSPGANPAAFAHPPGVAELDASSALPVINETAAPQQYQAYRPPQPVAEMPSVKTPPEDLERQIHHR